MEVRSADMLPPKLKLMIQSYASYFRLDHEGEIRTCLSCSLFQNDAETQGGLDQSDLTHRCLDP